MHIRDGMEGDKMIMKAWRCFESQDLVLSNTVTCRLSTQSASLILYYLMAN